MSQRHLWDNENIQPSVNTARLARLHTPVVTTNREERGGCPSDLQEGFFGCGQQIDSGGKLLEELGGQIAQSDALDPVHQQVQVGPDLDAAGPLVEPRNWSWTTNQPQITLN